MAKKPSKAGRIARLGGLTSRVSGSYLGQRIKGAFQDEEGRSKALRRLHLENAERMVETMGALKGAAMKVGQQFALLADGMDLPPEVSRILSKLNNEAQPISMDIIREDLEEELERPIDDLFAWFDPEPLGTASLAQAHRARLPDGRAVVVKVLHRGVEDSVQTDLGALKSLLVTGRVLKRDKEEIDNIFAEIKDRLTEELDYYQEAANLEFFRRALSGMEGIAVPGSHPTRSGTRVLTMDEIPGLPLERFLETATPEARQRAGDLLATVFHEMFYKLRTLHSDPHGGNFLFQPDGSIGMVDFGCVKRFDAFWVADYSRLAKAGMAGDRETTVAQAIKLGILSKRNPDAEQVLWELCTVIGEAFPGVPYSCGSANDTVTEDVRKLGPRLLRQRDLRTPRDLVFLHRTLGGFYGMLRKLHHTADYRAIFERYADHAIGVVEGTVADDS